MFYFNLCSAILKSFWLSISYHTDSSILNADDKDMIQDLIMIAINEAIDKVDNAKKEKFGSMSQGLKF